MSNPSTTIRVLSGIPLDNSYEHTLWFDEPLEQASYFILHNSAHVLTNYTIIRPGYSIKVAGDVANAQYWNYLQVRNPDGKYYYYFVTKVTYLNECSVVLDTELDVMQTYLFDYDLRQCFIERTHTRTDGIGEHTVDEGLELGELMDIHINNYFFDEYVILMLATKDGENNTAYSKVYGNVFSGLAIYAIEMTDYKQLGTLLDGDAGACVALWMYPKALVSVTDSWGSQLLHPVSSVSKIEYIHIDDILTDANGDGTIVDGWIEPKNNKLYTYPYSMLLVSNNMGNSATFKRELFHKSENSFLFRIEGAMSPDCGVQLIPYGYNARSGNNLNYDYALSIGAFPTCAWDSDVYKVWLAQNQNQVDNSIRQANIQAGIGILSVGAGAGLMATTGGAIGGGSVLGGAGTILNAYNNVQTLMAQQRDLEVQPPQAKGNHSGNINLANGRMGFTFCFKGVRPEIAYRIDEYFTRYGYKVNRLDYPTRHNRKRYTFIKTQGCTLVGVFDCDAQLKIQSIFDRGVTFWADHKDVGIYGDNPCLE